MFFYYVLSKHSKSGGPFTKELSNCRAGSEEGPSPQPPKGPNPEEFPSPLDHPPIKPKDNSSLLAAKPVNWYSGSVPSRHAFKHGVNDTDAPDGQSGALQLYTAPSGDLQTEACHTQTCQESFKCFL